MKDLRSKIKLSQLGTNAYFGIDSRRNMYLFFENKNMGRIDNQEILENGTGTILTIGEMKYMVPSYLTIYSI